MAKIVKLILTEERIGLGKERDPVRKLRQLWTMDGEFVAEEHDKFYKSGDAKRQGNNFNAIK